MIFKKLWTDRCFTDIHKLDIAVMKEHRNQINKWGIQTHTPFEWLTYTTEELGELAKAISDYIYRDGNKESIFNEAIQTATLSLKIAEMNIIFKKP